MNISILEKHYNGDWFNYFRLSLELPTIKFSDYKDSIEEGKRFEIRFNTIFIFDKCDNISWYLCLKVFGIGISIARQWSY